MTQTPLHPTPRLHRVVTSQIHAIGQALRRPALFATALVAATTLYVSMQAMDSGVQVIHFHPEHHALPGMLGVLLPAGIWAGEERFGSGFLWTLPVDRRQLALAKVFGGWVWLMAAVALLVLWLFALTLSSGGNVLAEETRRVLSSFSFSAAQPFDPSTLRDVRWKPDPIFWLVPFTASTAAYFMASALALGTRRPLWWIAGTVFGYWLVVLLGEAANSVLLVGAADRLLEALVNGPLGVNALLTARTESLQVSARLSTGQSVIVWRALPDVLEWLMATLLWTGSGLSLLWAAASRHGERRRSWIARFRSLGLSSRGTLWS